MRKLAVVSVFLVAIAVIATAIPPDSEAFGCFGAKGYDRAGCGPCSWDSSSLYGWAGYGGWGGGYGRRGMGSGGYSGLGGRGGYGSVGLGGGTVFGGMGFGY
ncbi:MAG: hypothetical protein HY912_22870 [Desulfomonile tiedjei]|uniref:Uncharacterized protein n=1 Tax=Desulfomonile tiedjei TaxID=2358 RepID=A0A9D6V695_9BACT|nr:hypothetical protein [Desulfomonile tiedjei]